MKSNLKLQIIFTDRVGIAADVASLLSEQGINIAFFEMVANKEQTTIYVDAEGSKNTDWDLSIGSLETLTGVRTVSIIETLPQEEREKRLQVALDSISDGILSIDKKGQVAIINRVARHILGCNDRNVTGRNIRDLNHVDTDLEKCLTGESFTNVKKNMITPDGRFQFLSTGKSILDSSGSIVGAVEIMKDMEEIKELSTAVSTSSQFNFTDMIGCSTVLMEAISFAQKIAGADVVVSICGDSGTGKELFANAIHAESGRSGLFVPVNCAAIPETLLESELFGYVGGSFSGAKRGGKAGLFELAEGGTLFLDEIAEIPLALQGKMLRVLQAKKNRRIGGTEEIPIDVRIITATNKNLAEMVGNKLFREDLYYRINVFPLYVPPLYKRHGDIVPLAEHFLFHINSSLEKKWQSLSRKAIEKLEKYSWPGNIRELKNVIERAAILCDDETIDESYVLLGEEFGRVIQEPQQIDSVNLGSESLSNLVIQMEKQYITAALQQTTSKRQAARVLGMTHTALNNRVKKYGM